MPINAGYEYGKAESEFNQAATIQEKLTALMTNYQRKLNRPGESSAGEVWAKHTSRKGKSKAAGK